MDYSPIVWVVIAGIFPIVGTLLVVYVMRPWFSRHEHLTHIQRTLLEFVVVIIWGAICATIGWLIAPFPMIVV